jgi:hypothetical protein
MKNKVIYLKVKIPLSKLYVNAMFFLNNMNKNIT